MNKLFSLILVLMASTATAQITEPADTTVVSLHIEGKFLYTPCDTVVYILPFPGDPRTVPYATTSVRDGRFSYDFVTTDATSPYSLWAEGDLHSGFYTPGVFLAVNDTLRFTFDRPHRSPLMQALSADNRELAAFRDTCNRRFDFREVFERSYDFACKGEDYRPSPEEQQWRVAGITGKQAYEEEYIRTHHTLTTLYLVMDCMFKNRQYTPAVYDSVYCADLIHRFPGNTMHEYIREQMAAREMRVGGRMIDITAPDADGRMHSLADLTRGRVAWVDIWASWCAPCREKSRAMIPVYEAWKDRGFTVVGLSREQKVDHMVQAVRRDGYPWTNLVLLNDDYRRWYTSDSFFGSTFLLDRDGTILAIDPTREEVEALLEKLLPSD